MMWVSNLLKSLSKPFQWWVVVAPWEQGLRVRLGKRTTLLMPGIHWRIPYLDRLYRICTRMRMVSENGQTITTADGRVVTIGVAVEYAIADARRLFETVARPEETLLAKTQAIVADYVCRAESKGLTSKAVQEHATEHLDVGAWGLKNVKAYVLTFAFVRTYRLLQSGDQRVTGLDYRLDQDEVTR